MHKQFPTYTRSLTNHNSSCSHEHSYFLLRSARRRSLAVMGCGRGVLDWAYQSNAASHRKMLTQTARVPNLLGGAKYFRKVQPCQYAARTLQIDIRRICDDVRPT